MITSYHTNKHWRHITAHRDGSLGAVPRLTDTALCEHTHYLPDENGELLVLAACMKHYSKQTPADLRRGRWADCTNPQCKG